MSLGKLDELVVMAGITGCEVGKDEKVMKPVHGASARAQF